MLGSTEVQGEQLTKCASDQSHLAGLLPPSEGVNIQRWCQGGQVTLAVQASWLCHMLRTGINKRRHQLPRTQRQGQPLVHRARPTQPAPGAPPGGDRAVSRSLRAAQRCSVWRSARLRHCPARGGAGNEGSNSFVTTPTLEPESGRILPVMQSLWMPSPCSDQAGGSRVLTLQFPARVLRGLVYGPLWSKRKFTRNFSIWFSRQSCQVAKNRDFLFPFVTEAKQGPELTSAHQTGLDLWPTSRDSKTNGHAPHRWPFSPPFHARETGP